MNTEFKFYAETIAPASMQKITVNIDAGNHTALIPVIIFNGTEPGPVLAVTAGVHGYEYPPIIAAQQLIPKINPDRLKGTVILVPIVNVDGFLKRSVFINPLDGKNLNRVFPGNEKGSITERIAHFITTKVSARADYFLDIHAGDAPQELMPYAAHYSNGSMKSVSEKGREMARALGFDYIVNFVTDNETYMQDGEDSLFCSAEAFKQGIPSIDIECGGLGQTDVYLAQRITSGVVNLLRYLGMYEAPTRPNPKCLTITRRSWINSPFTGIFYPKKSAGNYVYKGMEIGTITDFFGKELGTVQADMDGIILYLLGTPPVNKEETVACLGEVNPVSSK